jgi:hypothetical protein
MRTTRLERASTRVAGASAALGRPRLRGVLHQAGFLIALAVAPLLIVGADGGRAVRRSRLRRFGGRLLRGERPLSPGDLDVAGAALDAPRRSPGVYILIAGTYTPVCLLVLDGVWRFVVLTVVWIGVLAAIVFKFTRSSTP